MIERLTVERTSHTMQCGEETVYWYDVTINGAECPIPAVDDENLLRLVRTLAFLVHVDAGGV